MCGIAGLVRYGSASLDAGVLDRMTDAAAHRGPDGRGVVHLGWRGAELVPVAEDGHWSIGLGHRRLSILDLSEAGAQPMRRGDLWITYNGEVYDYLERRA